LDAQAGVSKACVFSLVIIRFLDSSLLPRQRPWAERLVRQRTTLGLSQKDAARELGVDPSTLAKWEQGERQPAGEFLSRVKRFMGEREAWQSDSRRVG
jgi:ribosome-binding protein aMBF1 (putative translation factor)